MGARRVGIECRHPGFGKRLFLSQRLKAMLTLHGCQLVGLGQPVAKRFGTHDGVL